MKRQSLIVGLKTDIYNAFKDSIAGDGDVSKKNLANIDTLAQALEDAMVKFMKAQELKITELEAPYNILPGQINVVGASGPSSNTAPVKGIVQVSETSNKVMDGKVPAGVNKSKVIAKKIKGLG